MRTVYGEDFTPYNIIIHRDSGGMGTLISVAG